jgi:hypothetical protein
MRVSNIVYATAKKRAGMRNHGYTDIDHALEELFHDEEGLWGPEEEALFTARHVR